MGHIHTSSLASTFLILFLTSPCLFSTYHLCFLFLVPFPHYLPSLSPEFVSLGCTCKLFGISISYTILNLPLSIFYLPFMLIPYTFSPISPIPFPPTFPPYSSCPWVTLISSLASTFPMLFLPSPCLFSTYHLCYLFSVPFPSSLPLPLLC